jgi:hypothetical protein
MQNPISHLVLGQLRQRIDDPRVMHILEQYVRHSVYDGGLYQDVQRGISLCCSLSPLMGAVYLHRIDEAMQKTGLFYARFMDDWIVVAPSRWKLRTAIRTVNRILNALKVVQHPDKTFIGRASRGFDFLGYHFAPGFLRVAQRTLRRFADRVSRHVARHTRRCDTRAKNRLYERASVEVASYARRFNRWTTAGLQSVKMPLHVPSDVAGLRSHQAMPIPPRRN